MHSTTEDWEATCLIYNQDGLETTETSTILNKERRLLRGSIHLGVKLNDTVFCRRVTNKEYRFWKLEDEADLLIFLVVFWCDLNEGDYERLEISLISQYPPSFPQESQDTWLEWIRKEARSKLTEDQLSYSVCMFVEHHALEFFPRLLENGEHILVLFDDGGPTFYDLPTIIADPTSANIFPVKRQYPNGSTEIINELSSNETKYIFPLLMLGREWLPIQCPICFDTISPQQAATISCNHSFCRSCISTYLRIKVEELSSENPSNPFTCPLPECRHGMKIVGCVKQFLPLPLMDKVRQWYKDVKNPPCWSLTACLKRDCNGGVLRKEAVDSCIAYCELCDGQWCELCLKRAARGHEENECRQEVCLKFCERYLFASEAAKERCEEKWPWIKVYAKSRIHDLTMINWIQSNGQVCPQCRTGIERIEGCFHMKCKCGTHFCYECGEEIHPPFYGTHHCWELAS